MTVSYRQPSDIDRHVWGPGNTIIRHEILFPWRAEHEVGHCNWGGVFYSEREADHALATHTCSLKYKRMNGMSISESYWMELDRVIDSIKTYTSGEVALSAEGDKELLRLQGRAGGLAFAIVQANTPHYADEKAVSKEALRRWKMRNGQMDYESTPGFRYSPMPPERRAQAQLASNAGTEAPATYTQEHNSQSAPTPAPVSGRRRRQVAATKPDKQLTELEKETIRKTGGAFPAKDLAGMYGVSEATIQAILAG